ncbi:unnamed protein product [Heterosigma akashiwo]
MKGFSIIFTVLVLACISVANGFTIAPPPSSHLSSLRPLKMSKKPYPEGLDPDVGYGPMGTLQRQGLLPFLIRVFPLSPYDAAVEKYMKRDGCDKVTAQANMDAYFNDPNGWAANKAKGLEIDYVNQNVDKGGLLLTFIWSIGITGLLSRIFMVQVLGM